MAQDIRINPIGELMNEHKSVLELMNQMTEVLATAQELNPEQWQSLIERGCRFFQGDVAVHFKKEEEALFPAMEKYMGRQGGPIAVMLREHEDHNANLTRLVDAVQGRDLNGIRSSWNALNQLLTVHIFKEDTVLFPMAERILSAEDSVEVGQKMETINLAAGASVSLPAGSLH